MLKLNFKVSIDGNCKSLLFSDITGFQAAGVTGGYGGSNININEITKTILRIITPDKVEYEIFSTYLPTQGDWKIDASSISDLQKVGSVAKVSGSTNDCGCPNSSQDFIVSIPYSEHKVPGKYNNRDCEKPNSLNHFEDSCTTFTYEVYSKTGIPVKTCQFMMGHKLCEGQSVWVKRNGGWYNVTNQGALNNMNFSLVIPSTIDVYTDWEIRDSKGVASKGTMDKFNCTNSGDTASSATDVMIAAHTITFPFICNVNKLIDKIASELTIDFECDSLRAGVSEKKALELFALSVAKIDSVKNGAPCGCGCVMDSINSAITNLKAVVREEKLSIETC